MSEDFPKNEDEDDVGEYHQNSVAAEPPQLRLGIPTSLLVAFFILRCVYLIIS